MSAHSAAYPRYAYRLLLEPELRAFESSGVYAGSAIDARDGYLHMSTSETVLETADKYYAGQASLWAVKIDLNAIAANVQWDPVASRGGVEFPHLYGQPLPISAIVRTAHIEWSSDHFSMPTGLLDA